MSCFESMYYDGLGHILKVIPHQLSEKVQRSYYVTRPRFSQAGLGMLCPILYMTCGVFASSLNSEAMVGPVKFLN